MNKLTRDM